MQAVVPLQPERFYHLYNRGNNREDLFRSERDYRHLLKVYARHISSIADTYAYCLMRNHFHLLVRIKSEQAWRATLAPEYQTTEVVFNPSQRFSNLFNAYTKWFNSVHRRTGSLFEERFKRIEVTSDDYFTNLIFYIHFNPQKHDFVSDFREWPWSSFGTLMGSVPTKLQRKNVLD
jgi:REP element-mobilizing transposase RayT